MPLRQSRSCQGFRGDNTSADSSLWFASSSSSSMFIDDQSSDWRASIWSHCSASCCIGGHPSLCTVRPVDDLLTERLAELAVGFGANVQADQIVMVNAELGREPLARAVAAAAYRAGARYVDVTYTDAFVRRAKIENAGDEAIGYAPPWHVVRMKQMGEQRVAVISLEAALDPSATDGLDPVRLGADQSPVRQAYLRLVMERLINWCIIACPTPEWAARVHPDLPVDQALELLSQEIARVCRLDEDDPVAAWQTRFDRLTEISERLGEHRFEAIPF